MKGRILLAALSLAVLAQSAVAATPRAAEDASSPVGVSESPPPKVQTAAHSAKKGADRSAKRKAGPRRGKTIKSRRP